MRKKKNIINWVAQAVILIAFIFLQTSIGVSEFFSASKSEMSIAVQQDHIPFENEEDLPFPFSDPEEKTETSSDSNSESIQEAKHLLHPFFGRIKTKADYRSDLFHPDHFELLSPPPKV